MNKQAADALAMWMLKEHPDIFLKIYQKQTGQKSTLGRLGDWTDVLSAIGTGASDAASAVGSWMSTGNNAQTLVGVASNVFGAQSAPTQVLNTQVQRAQYGQAPANISYANNGDPFLVSTGQRLTPTTLSSLAPGFLSKYGLPLALAGGLGLLFFIL